MYVTHKWKFCHIDMHHFNTHDTKFPISYITMLRMVDKVESDSAT